MIPKIYCFLFILIASITSMMAQVTDAESILKAKSTVTEDVWVKGLTTGLNMSQTTLKNWAAGGQESFALNAYLNVFANHKKGKLAWDNSLNVGYGLLKQKSTSYYMKTDDKFDILSKFGVEAFKNFYYAGMVNFKTQMDEGYNYPDVSTPISKFMAPAYITAALGMDYKPNAYLSAFLAPITGKMTIVNDDTLSSKGAFGVDLNKKTRSEFGGYIRVIYTRNDFKPELLKNVSLTTKADFFSNYLNNPEKVDVNWENIISMKVNKYISVNLTTQLIYDYDVKFDELNSDGITYRKVDKVQFKEIFGAGISTKF